MPCVSLKRKRDDAYRLGRWTVSNPIGLGDGVNVYAYVQGNPVSGVDPSRNKGMNLPNVDIKGDSDLVAKVENINLGTLEDVDVCRTGEGVTCVSQSIQFDAINANTGYSSNEFEQLPLSEKMRILIFLSILFVLYGCSQDKDYFGTYTTKHKYGVETITLYPNYKFLQIYVDSNAIDSNKGEWRIESMKFYEPNRLILNGWVRFKDPIQSEESKYWEHKRSVGSFVVSDGCIVTDPDFQEFNPCR